MFVVIMTLLIVIGLIFLAMGIKARLGGLKGLYVVKIGSLLVPRFMKYGYIPLGLFVSIFAITILFLREDFAKMNYTVFYVLIAFFFIVCIFQPRWMLPHWLVYLRDTYGYEATEYLLDQASWNIPRWLEKVETHEGLVAWAEETMAKRKPRPKYRPPR